MEVTWVDGVTKTRLKQGSMHLLLFLAFFFFLSGKCFPDFCSYGIGLFSFACFVFQFIFWLCHLGSFLGDIVLWFKVLLK